jgi:fucose 4-O-acetylase-like acetyltransferase
MGKRYFFIDQLRAFAIFLLIFEHNDHSSVISEFSTSFSIPLFFALSAIVSSNKEGLNIIPFIKKQASRLLIPYFSLASLLFIFWFFIGRHFGESADKAYDPLNNFIGIFYAQGGPEFMNWGIPMWFLPALFVVSLIDFFVSKLPFKFRFIPALIIPPLGLLLYNHLGFHLPWSIDVAFAVYGFYFLGNVLREVNFIQLLANRRTTALFVILFFTIHLVGFQFNGRILYYYGDYDIFPLMYINGIAGFVWALALFSLLPKSKYVVWVGQNTLPILAFHLLAMTFIKGIAFFGFGTEIAFNPWLSLIYGVVQIIILVPAILFLNRYLPFLVGIRRKKDSGSN